MSADLEARIPGFLRGVRLQRDRVRDQWIVQAPERAFIVDTIAASILQRVDGDATLAAIIDALATAYDAPRDVIARDVIDMVEDLTARQVLVCKS
ncbi:pyrroloquinoline quinone biosynthesis peptide chaperone PqqD [Acetobacter sp. DsW_063]|uniref:pyrroloquinoline quinone biosynthesis peptide chaperone PqqD n=1 Tax=Acetobacter sp. DsW_063 TaxID=1514894 RepID=UPI000A370A3B|nr:pyrroloquinoline quinone biosynthesis peptide chaperone PqqD [Acetobacter sp. DsW_063]OUJ16293.1 pyrroloquinoline quinone biosynthesis protein PqqD [Acetobacter sp. DsW_063]